MNTSNVRKLFAALCASACALMSSAATTYTWTGAVNNKWSDPGNWKVGTAIATSHPHTNDDVVLYDSTSYASAEIELDIDGTTTVSHIVSSRGHLTITGIPGAVLSLYETVSPGASGIVVGRDSDLTTDRVLTLDVPVVTPTRRFDKWYGGTLEIVSAFTNLFNSASEYGFIWGTGSNLLTQAADVYIPNSRTATGCGNPSGVPSYLVISDAARLRARSLDLETRGSSGPGAYAIQNGANTVVTLGDLWIGYGGLATAENSYYRMEAGTLTAGRMIVGGNGGRTCNGCGRFEQLGGTVTVGTFLWGKVPEYDRYLLSGGTFLVSETQTLPDRIEISGTPAFGATAGKTLTVPQWPAGLEGAFVKKGAGRVSLGADFATARVIDVQEGSLDLTALASATVHPDGCLVKVATGASFTLNTSPFSAKLRIEAEEGAQVTLPNGVTAEGFMKVAGGTTYDVPSGTTQTLPVPMQIVGAGGLVKRGAGTLKVLAGFTSDHPLSVEAGRFTLMAGSRVEPSAEGGTWDVSISASGVLEVASYDAHVNVPLNLEIADGGRI